LEDLEAYVYEMTGTLQLAPGRRVRDYVEDLVERGVLKKKFPNVYVFV
jgi:hypothetical protein